MSLPPDPDLSTPNRAGRPDAAGLLNSLDNLQAIIEHVSGYRERAKAAGFSDPVAEQMALQLHAALMASASAKAVRQQMPPDT